MPTFKINTPDGLREFLKVAPEMTGFKFANPTDQVVFGSNKHERPVVSAKRVTLVDKEGARLFWATDFSGIMPQIGEVVGDTKKLVVVEEYGSTTARIWDMR